jgi:hypothetical protein
MDKWEYKEVEVMAGAWDEAMNTLGVLGWELVSMQWGVTKKAYFAADKTVPTNLPSASYGWVCFLKRKMPTLEPKTPF